MRGARGTDRLDRLDQRLPARLRRPELVLLAIAVVFAASAAVRADRLTGLGGDATSSGTGEPAQPAPGKAVAWFAAPLVPADAAALAAAGKLDVVGIRVDVTAPGQDAQPGQPAHRDVALPDGPSLEARMLLALEALAGELRAEAAELRGYARTTDMADFTAQYEADAARLDALAAREPAGCVCVAALLPESAPEGPVPGVDRVEKR